ncbi:hypothetical protein EYF80_035803 [Liparis tanakae]|uniref:Uncharacterized protein n=1 Tax=Liparis tanakae TaxID=230148 RepID=A0A4Z2GKX6_9TELE|nr:hypothetical protein EYF80_035803 [Liparis tanakae]
MEDGESPLRCRATGCLTLNEGVSGIRPVAHLHDTGQHMCLETALELIKICAQRREERSVTACRLCVCSSTLKDLGPLPQLLIFLMER